MKDWLVQTSRNSGMPFAAHVGVWGNSNDCIGVFGSSNRNVGVDGRSNRFVGVFGSSAYTGSVGILGTIGGSASIQPNSGVAGFSGDGNGVSGFTQGGYGVHGYAQSPSGAGVFAEGSGTNGTALRIGNGAIQVVGAGIGTNTTAFIHIGASGTITCGFSECTLITHPLTDGDPNAILIVTPNYGSAGGFGVYDNHPIGVYYSGAKWGIFNQDSAAMPVNTAFNVLVIKP